MPGDERHEEAGAPAFDTPDADSGSVVGPRHAAPKKPLLTRLHVPAGKAIAIAAMPSAVLMGMGLTPQLAHAKPIPKNPFGSGPCVSQPDKDSEAVEEEALKAEKEKAEKAKEKAAAEKAAAEKKEEAEKDSESPSPTPTSPSAEPSESAPPAGDDASAEPEEENPLDPLGLGDTIGDALTPEEKEAEESAAPEPSASPTDEASAGSDAADKVEETAGKVGDGVKDTTDKLEQGVEGAKDKLPGAEKADDSSTGEDGKKAFPCVEKKKSDGTDEQTPAALPNDPWRLEASSLGLHGLDYKGVVNVKTANGETKQTLKFTADSLDIGDLHQTVEGPDGNTYHVKAEPGSTSTIKGGKVTMYTEELKGNLFGLIPITFDPEHPPPINIDEAYFTKVTVKQAGQFGGNLTIPGLHQYVD